MKNIQIDKREENQGVHALIQGSLIIRDSVELKEELLNLLESHQTVEVSFKNIEKIDLAALQLLVALSNTAIKRQKLIRYHFEQTEYINTLLNNSGFNSFFLSRQ